MAHGTCRECADEDRYLPGRGLCAGCYDRRWRAGTLDAYPVLPRPLLGPPRTEKPCFICKQVLPLDAFPLSKNNRRDGRGPYCKPCAREKYHAPARERKRRVEQYFDGEQTCRKCQETKAVSEFHWESDKGRYRYRCKSCHGSSGKKYWKARGSTRQRERVLSYKFKMTVTEYETMLAAQGNGCAICGKIPGPDELRLAIDHCHTSGQVRALLCGSCNMGIGMFREDPDLLTQAAIYCEKYALPIS